MLFTQLVQICCVVSMCAAAWATLWATATVGNLKAHAGTRWWNQTDVVSLLTLDETVRSFSEPWGTSGPHQHAPACGVLKSSEMFRYSLSTASLCETILCEEQIDPSTGEKSNCKHVEHLLFPFEHGKKERWVLISNKWLDQLIYLLSWAVITARPGDKAALKSQGYNPGSPGRNIIQHGWLIFIWLAWGKIVMNQRIQK